MLLPPQKRTCGAVGERAMPWIRSRAKIRWDLVRGEPEVSSTLTKGPSPTRRRGSVSGEVWKARDVMGEVLATCWVGEMGRSAGIEGELSRNGMQLGGTRVRVRREAVPADLGPSCEGFRSGCSRVWRER